MRLYANVVNVEKGQDEDGIAATFTRHRVRTRVVRGEETQARIVLGWAMRGVKGLLRGLQPFRAVGELMEAHPNAVSDAERAGS